MSKDVVLTLGELSTIDERLSSKRLTLKSAGYTYKAIADTIEPEVSSLIESAVVVANSARQLLEFDIAEEIIDRWIGYLSYHGKNMPMTALVSPPVP